MADLNTILQGDPIEAMRQVMGQPPMPQFGAQPTVASQNVAQARPMITAAPAMAAPGGGVPNPGIPPAAMAPAVTAPAAPLNPANTNAMPVAPQIDPRRAEIQAQRTKDATPLDTDDPQYKSSIWQKLLALAAAAAQGYAGGHNGLEIGKSATHSGKYYRDEEARKGRLASDDQQIENLDKEFGMRERQFEAGARVHDAQERSADRTQNSKWRQEDRERDDKERANQPINGLAPVRIDKDPMTGAKRYYYKTKGGGEVEGGPPARDAALEETTRHNKATEAIERTKADTAAGKTANGKTKRGTPDQFNELEQKKSGALAKARAAQDEAIGSAKLLGDKAGTSVDDAKRAREQAEMDAELEYGQGVKTLGGDYQNPLMGGKAGYNWSDDTQKTFNAKTGAMRGQPEEVPPQGGGPAKPPKPGAVIDRGTAKKYLDAAGGDPQKARELAKKDGWGIPQKGK